MSPCSLLSVAATNSTPGLPASAERRVGRRRPATTSAEVERVGAKALERGEAHGVDRRFGHAEAQCIGAAEPEQHLGAAGGKAAPVRPAFFPAGDSAVGVDMGRPHAATRAFAQNPGADCGANDALGEMAALGEIAPGRRPAPRPAPCMPAQPDREVKRGATALSPSQAFAGGGPHGTDRDQSVNSFASFTPETYNRIGSG